MTGQIAVGHHVNTLGLLHVFGALEAPTQEGFARGTLALCGGCSSLHTSGLSARAARGPCAPRPGREQPGLPSGATPGGSLGDPGPMDTRRPSDSV